MFWSLHSSDLHIMLPLLKFKTNCLPPVYTNKSLPHQNYANPLQTHSTPIFQLERNIYVLNRSSKHNMVFTTTQVCNTYQSFKEHSWCLLPSFTSQKVVHWNDLPSISTFIIKYSLKVLGNSSAKESIHNLSVIIQPNF